MTALASRYFAAAEPATAERRRLELLEARYDPLTFRRLDNLGPSEGWSCLEIGAGAGSVARWLANRVGPSGRVVATDLHPRFLTDIGRANVDVRRHDIRTDPLEADAFDLVHCRALLGHLEDPMAALRRMADALRPGGWLLVEDADYATFAAACPDHPAAARWDEAVLRIAQSLARGDRIDPNLGRRLPGILHALGLEQRGHEGLVRVHQGASPAAEFFLQTIEPFRQQRIDAIDVSNTDLEALTAALVDPSFAFVDAISYAAWGRR